MNTTIPQPSSTGVWHVDAEAYHADFGRFGKSMLDVFRRSPKRFHGLYVAGTLQRDDPTPALEFGKLFHCFVLEPKRFAETTLTIPLLAPDGAPWDRRKKDHKAAWADLEDSGLELVTLDTFDLLTAMRDAILGNFDARSYIDDDGAVEQAIYWTDTQTSLPLKAMRDKVARNGRVIVDVKTCRDSSPQAFAREAANYGYYRQAAHYLDGHKAAFGEPADGMVFIAVSKEPPHDVACYELDSEAIELGRSELRCTLTRLAECFSCDDWEAPHQKQINLLSLPKYAFFSDQWEI